MIQLSDLHLNVCEYEYILYCQIFVYRIVGQLTVIKFGSLPSQYISLILMGYNLMDW